MRRVTRNGLIAAAAASGALAVTMPAYADSTADGASAGSPGVISGNTVQLPVHVPVNVCGNTVDVVGVLNPAMGNGCANTSGGHGHGHGGATHGGSAAHSAQEGSPGVVSGTGIALPVDLPVNVSGNSASVVGIGNPVMGNESANSSGDRPHHPGEPAPQPPGNHEPPAHHEPPGAEEPPESGRPPAAAEQQRPEPGPAVTSLASTGADATVPAAFGAAAMLLGGAVLYRRFRPAATR
ncbi:chaplin [Streptomyces sp. NPDC059786]|uniref:chaplin n=1 Tax=Streptomyces sp. NPDC059786 TaxID=3346946 RepID=UPI003666BAC9